MDSETVSLEILDAGTAVRRAEKAVELDSPLRAMGLLSELKSRFPAEARLWHLSGRVLETMGCDRAAEENYRQALSLDPCREDFVLDLAELLYQGDRIAEAETLAAAMASRYPESARALGLLGVARAERGASPEAEATLRRALDLDPCSSRVARRLALLLCRRGDAPGARDVLHGSLRAEPDDARTLSCLGCVERRLGEAEAAERAFRRALDLEPQEESAFEGLFALLLTQGRSEEAHVLLESILGSLEIDEGAACKGP